MNPYNTCFAASATQVVVAAGLDQHLDPTVAQDAGHRGLAQVETYLIPLHTIHDTIQVVRTVCGERRDPAQPPVDPMPMIGAVNGVTNNRFNAAVAECAVNFLQSLLENISLLPQYLTCHDEVGTCLLCQQPYRQVTRHQF